ncbi:response regulator [uncultured Robinsoniella sp.]|uniref:response regulator n=1 Tax=uncultured Robinsoniella sp. TaxID=904190 RepID=UPI00374F8A2C
MGMSFIEKEYDIFIKTIQSSAGKCIFDTNITFLCGNHYFYESTGYTAEEYLSLFPDFRQYFKNHIEEFHKIRDAITQALSQGKRGFTTDCRLPVKSGSFIWIRINGTITAETVEGHPVFYMVNSDISDLIQSRDEKTQYIEWLMDEYMGNIYISDMNTYELLYVNRTSCETLKTDKKDVIGRRCYEAIQERTAPCPFCTNDKLRTDESYEWEFFNPVLERTFMIKNRQINWHGRKSRIELSYDMYSSEFKLAKKEREREILLKTLPGGFARLDARDYRSILWYGSDFLKIIGYTKEQFEEELDSKCDYVHPEDLKRIVRRLKEIEGTDQSLIMEARILTRSGDTKILTITLCYADGEDSWDGIPSFYTVGIDMTKDRLEQARQQAALEEAYMAARVANSAKTRFLSSMSHDTRTPLNAIIGMSTIAKANLSDPVKVEDCLNKIDTSSQYLLSLINEILDMSQIEAGKIDLLTEVISLPKLIQNLTDICRPLLDQKQQKLLINVGKVLHENIITDGDRLQQVFMNLLSNSIKYTSPGGTISLFIDELMPFNKNKGQYKFVFSDTGIGMTKEFLPHIFEPFSRAEDSRISKINGTGLGMSIAENIVKLMGGSIEVKSEIGKGSQFTISIPFCLPDKEESVSHQLTGRSILIVNDKKSICENVTTLLNEHDMQGYRASSSFEAQELITAAYDRAEEFFAVLLNWDPDDPNDTDNLNILKNIRQSLGDHVPVIIITPYECPTIESDLLQAGATAFLTSPIFTSKIWKVFQLFSSGSKITEEIVEEATHTTLSGKRILLVEDNELNREIATELLHMQGILIETAENGQDAVDKFLASCPGYFQAILMDIQMPVMNGYDAASAIRLLERKDARKIPILAMTANAFITDISKAYSVGMNDYITKPIDMEGLIITLEKWILQSPMTKLLNPDR